MAFGGRCRRATRANHSLWSWRAGHGGPIGGDGRSLASAATDGSLYLWDLARPGLHPTSLRGHDLSIAALRFSPEADPGYLLS